MRRTRPTRLATIAALAVLAPLTPLLLAEPATAAPAPLTIENPGFEEGTDGWTLTSGAGVASNKPHGGSKLAYLDAGHGKQVSQKIKVSGDGTYDFSAWIATGGTAGTFFARVNGSTAASVVLPERPTYARYTLSRISLKRGDELELAFGSGNGWINADDLMVSPSAPVDPVVSSSDPEIVEMFNWAKRKANSWVQQPGTNGPLNVDENNSAGTGTGTYGPSYWAGYAHRSGYYSRDMAHQLSGASVLGLHDANKAMLSAFAASATEEHGYYPAWSFNFDNKTKLSIDYHSPTSFVREVAGHLRTGRKGERGVPVERRQRVRRRRHPLGLLPPRDEGVHRTPRRRQAQRRRGGHGQGHIRRSCQLQRSRRRTARRSGRRHRRPVPGVPGDVRAGPEQG